MSKTPLVKTSGRASAVARASKDAGSQALASNATVVTPPVAQALRRSLEVLEHLHDTAHAAGGARDFHGGIAFLGLHEPHQVHRPRLGDHLDVVHAELLVVEHAQL